MKHSILATALAATLFLGTPAQSQSLIAEYSAFIGASALTNSNGAALNQPWQVIRQDRANVHRFGRAHQGDGVDPVFGNRTMRARLGDLCRASGGFPFVTDTIARYGGIYVWVIVYQDAGQLTRMVVRNGAG